jgi:hypothetical protein
MVPWREDSGVISSVLKLADGGWITSSKEEQPTYRKSRQARKMVKKGWRSAQAGILPLDHLGV